MRNMTFALFLCVFSSILLGDNDKKQPFPNPFMLAHMQENANYLESVIKLDSAKENYQTKEDKWLWLQAALTYNSFIQNNPNTEIYNSVFYQPQDSVINCSLYDHEAVDFLKEQITGNQLVIINEQHWQPKHRFLGNMLLEQFYKEGFRYLAVETIDKKDEYLLNQRKYPLQSSGFYTKEPTFGNFIRNALQMGFEVIGYDTISANREYLQADRIYESTFKKNSKAKVLVWCGIAHVSENESDNPRMGYHLKKLTGIDPLTIEQTLGDMKSKFLKHHFLAIEANIPQTPIHTADIYIYNNFKESDFSIVPGSTIKAVNISLSEETIDCLTQYGKILLMIFNKKEFENHGFETVPLVNYLIESETPPVIQLSKGEYIVIKRSPGGSIIEQRNLSIN